MSYAGDTVWGWFRRLWPAQSVPLQGAPVRRRLKSYLACTGYRYSYYYEGYRRCHRKGLQGVEYVFSIYFRHNELVPVPVFLPDEVVVSWERDHSRELNATERYALVKMSLFHAFDHEEPAQLRKGIAINREQAEQLLEILGID